VAGSPGGYSGKTVRGALSRRRLLRGTAIGAGAAAFLAACGGGGEDAAEDRATQDTSGRAPGATATAVASQVQPGGELIYAAARDVTTLDGHVGTLGDEVYVYYGLYDASLTYNDEAQLIPNLAESFEQPDNTTIVLKYRTGVQFHDGTPFGAQAVKANWDRYLDPATGTTGAASLSKKLAKYEQVDDRTMRVTLVQPDAIALPSTAGIRMISPPAAERLGKDLARNPVGTGPFKFKEWLKDDHLTMTRNEQYWNAAKAPVRVPRVDSFTFKPIVEPTVMLANLKTRSIHIAGAVQAADFDRTKSEPGVVAVQRRPSATVRMYINVTRAPTNDKRVREAISLAIDRDAIGKASYFGLGTPAKSYFAPTHWMYPKDRPPFQRDVAGARAKLREAGQENLRLDMILPAAEPYRTISQVLQASLAEAGITVQIKQLESGQFLEALRNKDGQLALDAIGARNDPDGFFSGNFKADSPFNFAGFNDPQFEKALAEGLTLTDQEQRRQRYLLAEQRLLDELPGVVLYNPPGLYAQLDQVQDYKVVDFVGGTYDVAWLKKS
jgi:peptide/nickel transport system substrate-binding protein